MMERNWHGATNTIKKEIMMTCLCQQDVTIKNDFRMSNEDWREGATNTRQLTTPIAPTQAPIRQDHK